MAEDDEEEDLLAPLSSDNEDLISDSEDRQDETNSTNTLTFSEKINFIATTVLVIISATCLLIILPLFTESLSTHGDAYAAILFLNITSVVVFLLLAFFCGLRVGLKAMLFLPFSISDTARISLSFGSSAILVIYSLDRSRVVCHLQDPIKGIVLVFALVLYFCCSRKALSLHKIFCCTTIIVGLFISVDYGLCDEFRCRGYERRARSQDAGDWSLQTHTAWTLAYVLGLFLWTAHYALLEVTLVAQDAMYQSAAMPGLLATVSSQIFNADAPLEEPVQRLRPALSPALQAVTVALWTHLISLVLSFSLSWTDMIEFSSPAGMWNATESAWSCLVAGDAHCHARGFAWLAVAVYVCFTLAALHLLAITRSAVITVATATAALPLGGIFWSLLALDPTAVTVSWSPTFSGELICSLLGLPVVYVALVLLCRAFLTQPPPPAVRLRA